MGLSLASWGQVSGLRLTESMRAVRDVSSQLGLDEVHSQAILQAALPWDACLAHWNEMQDSLEAAPMSESGCSKPWLLCAPRSASAVLPDRKDIRAALDSTAQVDFDALALPERPRVLHFGVHNRMDCNVCKTPQPPTP